MRHFQDSKLTLGAVVLAASLVATGCGSADDVARAYSSELAEAIAEAGSKMKNPVSWLKSGKTAASQTDDLSKKLATSPFGLTDQSRKLPELVAETLGASPSRPQSGRWTPRPSWPRILGPACPRTPYKAPERLRQESWR